MKKMLYLWSAVLLIFSCGCISSDKKLSAEDPQVLVLYAREIGVLRDPYIAVNSKEKFDAAMYLAEKVDFTYLRNIDTADKIFPARDAHFSNDRRDIVFYYPYQDKSISFRFKRQGTVIYSSDVVIK